MSFRRVTLGALLAAAVSCDPEDVNEGDFLFAATVRASLGPSRAQADGPSSLPAMSADGRYVVFSSVARNLVPLDTLGFRNIFRRDLRTGVTELVSVGDGGVAADGDSDAPSISGDGDLVAFHSVATNLIPGDGAVSDIFVRDVSAGSTVRVTENEAAPGTEANGASVNPVLSSDGAFVAFESLASDLVAGGTAGLLQQIFRRALPAGAVDLVSANDAGVEADGGIVGAQQPSISADGSVVAFASDCPNLVANKNALFNDIFVRDFNALAPPFTTRVSIEAAGDLDMDGDEDPLGESVQPSVSADGRYVAYSSDASDIVIPDANPTADVFLFDRQAGTTLLCSVNSDGVQGNGLSDEPSIAGDGRTVAFASASGNLAPGDSNGSTDLFLRDLGRGTTIRLSVSTLGSQTSPADVSGQPSLSRDGRFCAFVSSSDLLVNGDSNGLDDVFVRGPLR